MINIFGRKTEKKEFPKNVPKRDGSGGGLRLNKGRSGCPPEEQRKFGKMPLALAGGTVGFGIAGKAFDSQPLTAAGETTGKFIAPAINITMGGYVVRKLKDMADMRKNFQENKKIGG